jgi:hypothetical protein
MPTVADNAFAARMASKPPPESLNSDPEYRIFYDPPEIIQRAFGGRPWFFETGCVRVHRVGVFKGLGWELDPMLAAQCELEVTGVRITARPYRRDKIQRYDMEFVRRELHEDWGAPVAVQIVASRMGLLAEELKSAYAEVLGEHVL